MQILAKYQEIAPINVAAMPKSQKTKCQQSIQKFSAFVSQAISNLKGHNNVFKSLARNREKTNKNY